MDLELTQFDDPAVQPAAPSALFPLGTDTSRLPHAPLKGEVCTQFIRCNKPGCRCQTGAPHGPYFYRVWREGGRVHKVYVKSAEVSAVRAACENYKALSLHLRTLRSQREQVARQLQGEWRKTQRLLRQSDKSKSGA